MTVVSCSRPTVCSGSSFDEKERCNSKQLILDSKDATKDDKLVSL